MGVVASGVRGEDAGPARGWSCLVVDDSATEAALVRQMLLASQPTGVVCAVEELSAALRMRGIFVPDVIFLDLHLKDGPSLPRVPELRAAFPGSAIVMLTGSSTDDASLAAFSQGVNDYLRKEHLSSVLLTRAAAVAIERKRFERTLQQQAVTRKVVRKLLRELTEGNDWGLRRREIGRSMAGEAEHAELEAHLQDFSAMGLGELMLVKQDGARYEFHGFGLLEMTPGSASPTCHIPLGYLERALQQVTRRPTLGSEIACQSRGDAQCRFVVHAR